ncbi:thioesterase family protein [Aurantimonas sp. A2-1-M11]|uniref:acyl-CoA thioesterase n=1 Tax=Aurantimonas sp. A2-1-M11 TaxID=3113712 RepID=UPI002F95DFEC
MTQFPPLKAILWAPTIALSWLWGLGFFYAIHVTLTHGWLAFVAFASANVTGLFLFGWILGSPDRDAAAIFRQVQSAYGGIFLLCQLGAVALTIFGFAAYLWQPLFGGDAAIMLALLVLMGCAIGHALPLARLKLLHVAFLVVGVAAGGIALAGLPAAANLPAVPLAAFDPTFFGLVLPTLVGFLLGPWMDVQQWQRVLEIRREGGSVRLAYGAGSLLFLALLGLNALLAGAAGLLTIPSVDGVAQVQPAVALALAGSGAGAATLAYLVWSVVAAATTIDSFYVATRWHLAALTERSLSPLLAFVPAGLVSSPLWLVACAAAVAGLALQANLSQLILMLPFATLLVGGAACLVCEVLGARRRYDPVLCYLIGLAAMLVFLIGHVAPIPAFVAGAPLIALIGAFPMIGHLLFGAPPAAATGLVPAMAVPARVELVPRDETLPTPANTASLSHGFDGQTFVMKLMPTYDDTNSVGNVYFANYVRWVGKARELFFNICMPNFDLKSTSYYVLTKSFNHDFRREASEFDPVTVRIRIARHNRKFVTLSHEIHSESQGLLGRGEQSLMFVDTEHHRPLDIPRDIVSGFLPYWPKESPHLADTPDLASLASAQQPGT